MGRYFKFILPVVLVLFVFFFISRRFLQKPGADTIYEMHIRDRTGMDGLLVGAYAMLKGHANDGSGYPTAEASITDWAFSDIASDDACQMVAADSDAAALQNHRLTAGNKYLAAKWYVLYRGIHRTNLIIKLAGKLNDSTLSPEYKKTVIAEARFLRGVLHFEAAKLWRNIPYIDEHTAEIPVNKPVWDKIEADFAAAMKALPVVQPQIGRANCYAAEAFLAKTYLFDHQYAKAMPLLNDLIKNGRTSAGIKYKLGLYQDNFKDSVQNSPSCVFAVEVTAPDDTLAAGAASGLQPKLHAGLYTGCCTFYQPSPALADAFRVDAAGLPLADTDSRSISEFHITTPAAAAGSGLRGQHGAGRIDDVDPRIDWTIGRPGIPFLDWGICGGQAWGGSKINPYLPKKDVLWRSTQTAMQKGDDDWAANRIAAGYYNLIRFADVILWRAECEVETGRLAAAEADVNLIRARAADPGNWVHTYIDSTRPWRGFTNKPAAHYKIGLYHGQFVAKGQDYARLAVRIERRLEFGMEGMRFFDLQRYDGLYGGPASRFLMARVLNRYCRAMANRYPGNKLFSACFFTPGRNELYPIPQGQIKASGGVLRQNPLY